MPDRLKFTTVHTDKIEAIVGKDEMEIAAFHNGRYNPEEFTLISIQNPEDTIDLKPMLEKFKRHLHIRFSDVTKPLIQDGKTYLPIDNGQAKQIVEFILQNKEEKFFIHCEAGVSRSAGVGIAIECILNHNGNTEHFNLDDNAVSNHWRYTPNTLVRDLLIEQFLLLKGHSK
jgi:predicted protein tyrosine phosphatase